MHACLIGTFMGGALRYHDTDRLLLLEVYLCIRRRSLMRLFFESPTGERGFFA